MTDNDNNDDNIINLQNIIYNVLLQNPDRLHNMKTIQNKIIQDNLHEKFECFAYFQGSMSKITTLYVIACYTIRRKYDIFVIYKNDMLFLGANKNINLDNIIDTYDDYYKYIKEKERGIYNVNKLYFIKSLLEYDLTQYINIHYFYNEYDTLLHDIVNFNDLNLLVKVIHNWNIIINLEIKNKKGHDITYKLTNSSRVFYSVENSDNMVLKYIMELRKEQRYIKQSERIVFGLYNIDRQIYNYNRYTNIFIHLFLVHTILVLFVTIKYIFFYN
jgi:hypothetical protein